MEELEDRLFDDAPRGLQVQRRSFQLRKSLALLRRVVIPMSEKVTGWAAIIAVPTLITGYFGMNVPYPGFGEQAGFAASVAAIALTGLVLYLIFKRRDWL